MPSEVPPTVASASLSSRADVVVVGGGCMGASAAFHLARRDTRTASP